MFISAPGWKASPARATPVFNQTSTGGTQVFINASGKVGTITSSRRFKEEIKPMDEASQLILALRPVTFRYKSEIDPAGTRQFGLVADEVEKVSPDLIVRDKEGNPCSVRYDQINAMLLNEFLKEHKRAEEQGRKAQEQEATIAQLKCNAAKQEAAILDLRNEMKALTAQLKEQAARIHKVNAKLEAGEQAPRVVSSNR